MRQIRRIPVQLAGIAVAVCLAIWPAAVGAQLAKTDLAEGNPALAKVSSHLLRARALAAADHSAAEIAQAVPSLRLRDGLPEVEIRLESLTPQIVEKLRDRGLLVESFHLGYARAYGRLDPADLDEIAALPEVSTIYPMPVAGTRVGSALSQADATMRTFDVRTSLGYDGTGVTVGILSDSFNKSGLGGTVSGGVCTCAVPGSTCATVVTGMTNQTSGDLPPSIPILDDCTVGGPDCSFLIDEGAAIGELMLDAAPGLGFMFHSAFNSPADFAGGITELVNCGADLIVDDVFWPLEPFFQDGIIAQAAQAAVDGGVPYFSAAGNDATFGIDDTYLDGAANDNPCPAVKTAPDGDDLHDFGGGDQFAAITLPDNCDIYAELQWSEPFDGTLGTGASSDLDLYLLSSATPPFGVFNILSASTTKQGCGIPAASGGSPVETVFYYNNTGAPDTVFLAVEHCCGDENVEMRIVTISRNCDPTINPWDFEDGEAGETSIFVDSQIFGHPAAKDVIAVAATFYGEIDGGGGFLPGEVIPPSGQLDVEPFSSLGGDLPFYFDEAGNPLPSAPQIRFKPEVTGPDDTNTTFFGSDIAFDSDSDPNFFGTSAAAANSAAIAALILDATGENITPPALRQLLQQSTLDLELPGVDDLSGFGFADALNAVRSVDDTMVPLIDTLFFDLNGDPFLTTPSIPRQPLRALSTLTVGDGDYSGIEGLADTIIFADGFESGDTSAWSN